MARKSRLDQHRDEIIQLLDAGWPPAQLARKYGLTCQGMRGWLKRNRLEQAKNATLKRMRAVPDNGRGIPVKTFFGTIYLEKAESLSPMPAERKPKSGMCHLCGRYPIGKGNHRLCSICYHLDHRNPMGTAVPVVGTTVGR